MIFGLDTSKWEDNPATPATIDWAKAKAAGAQFVILKATEGTVYVDPVYKLHRDNTAGILSRGHYHYWRVNLDYAAQARHYFEVAGNLDLPPCLDLEDYYNDLPRGKTLENKVLAQLAEIDKLFGGRPCMLYTSPNILKNYLMLSPSSPLCKRKLWIANYGVSAPIIAPFAHWTFWQYTDRAPAAQYGISEANSVDANWYNGSWEDFRQEFLIQDVTPPDQTPVDEGGYYAFDPAAFWQRPDGGPLVTPHYNLTKTSGDKVALLNSQWQIWVHSMNNATQWGKITAPDWGPSKGFNNAGLLILNTLVYPGRNLVKIDKVITGINGNSWGRLVTVDMNAPVDTSINYIDTPHLVHKVYGSGKNNTYFSLTNAPLVPLVAPGERWIPMHWLEKITFPRTVSVTSVTGLNVRLEPGDLTSKVTAKRWLEKIVISSIVVAKGGIWGKCPEGWVALRYNDKNFTNWIV